MKRSRVVGAVVALAIAAALPSAPVHATPICAGSDRTLCGGRIIPEPMQTAGFLTYAEWIQAMQTLQKEHPDRVRFDQIGKTAGDRPLYDVVVTDFRAPAPFRDRTGLYFNGDIHGDERDGTEGFARVIEDLAESTDAAIAEKLKHEVLVFTDANPDGWQRGDVPDSLTQTGIRHAYTRKNGAGHDLNREWPIVGFQNPETFPLVDPEVRSVVHAHGDLLHRALGLKFAYAFDVHGSAGAQTPPNPQLMLDMLLSAGEHDLTRSMLQTQMADEYMRRLEATTSDNVLATLGALTGHTIYKVGDWDTSWDIYGYAVSGGFSDWMSDATTGLGAVSATIELWLNGEPGQENTFLGYNQLIEASNVHSMRVIVQTVMDLAARQQHAALHLPGSVAAIVDRTALRAHDGKGATTLHGAAAAAAPAAHAYPSKPVRFWSDLAVAADRPLVEVAASAVHGDALQRYASVVVPSDDHLDDPAFVSALGTYVRAGGTAVLTDGALKLLAGLMVLPASAIAKSDVYAGYVTITSPDDPLARGLRGPSSQKQTYEPVPLGYNISNTFSSSTSATTAPAWSVDETAWENAGGRTVGTTGSGRTSLGEIKLGRGHVRILGSLLPPPSGNWEHPFGVADYGVTYVGYTLLDDLLNATASLQAGPPSSAPVPTPKPAPRSKPPVVKGERLAATGVRRPTEEGLAFIGLAFLLAASGAAGSRRRLNLSRASVRGSAARAARRRPSGRRTPRA